VAWLTLSNAAAVHGALPQASIATRGALPSPFWAGQRPARARLDGGGSLIVGAPRLGAARSDRPVSLRTFLQATGAPSSPLDGARRADAPPRGAVGAGRGTGLCGQQQFCGPGPAGPGQNGAPYRTPYQAEHAAAARCGSL
jgi:hypothetical protein